MRDIRFFNQKECFSPIVQARASSRVPRSGVVPDSPLIYDICRATQTSSWDAGAIHELPLVRDQCRIQSVITDHLIGRISSISNCCLPTYRPGVSSKREQR